MNIFLLLSFLVFALTLSSRANCSGTASISFSGLAIFAIFVGDYILHCTVHDSDVLFS